MKVDLPPELEQIIEKKMASGWGDPVQIIGSALLMLDQQEEDAFYGWDKEELKREARIGFQQLDSKEYADVSLEDIISRLQRSKS